MAYPKRYLVLQLVLVLAASCLGLTSAWAQQTPDKNVFQLMLIGTDKALYDAFYDLNGTPVKVTAGGGGLSMPYKLPHESALKIYRTIPAPVGSPPGTKPTKQALAVVSINTCPAPLLITLAPSAPGSEIPLAGKSMTFSHATLPVNSAQVFNLSVEKLAAQLNGEAFMLDPGTSHVVNYGKPANRGDSFTLKVGMNNPDGTWHLLQSTDIFKEDGARMVILLFDSPNAAGKVGVSFITDWSAPPPDKNQSKTQPSS